MKYLRKDNSHNYDLLSTDDIGWGAYPPGENPEPIEMQRIVITWHNDYTLDRERRRIRQEAQCYQLQEIAKKGRIHVQYIVSFFLENAKLYQ